MVEGSDALFDDGVAPELAFDFDAAHISKWEGLATWAGAISMFFVLYNVIDLTVQADDVDVNPALHQVTDLVGPNYSDHSAVPVVRKEK